MKWYEFIGLFLAIILVMTVSGFQGYEQGKFDGKLSQQQADFDTIEKKAHDCIYAKPAAQFTTQDFAICEAYNDAAAALIP